jgi:hypothetical protein
METLRSQDPDAITIDEVMRLLGARDLEIFKLTKRVQELQQQFEQLQKVRDFVPPRTATSD